MTDSISLAETCISASAKVWKDDGEILATGIGLIPRLAVGVAKLTTNPDLMMTDGEAFLISNPVPMGPRDSSQDSIECYMTYSRFFKNIWRGFRHAMVTPSQIDCYGQTNISSIGSYDQPKVQLLGVRGFPGNFISHKNSIFIFVFALGADEQLLRNVGMGIIWSLLLLSSTLSLRKFYEDDFNNSVIKFIPMSGISYELIVFLKKSNCCFSCPSLDGNIIC